MAILDPFMRRPVSRRHFLSAGIYGAAGLALYSAEIARHWIEVTEHKVALAGLPQVFEGMRIVQVSDIHMDQYTEPFFLRHVVNRVNSIKPDIVLLTGDYVTLGLGSRRFAIGAAWQCANLLSKLECRKLYAVLGNHDLGVGPIEVTEALTANGITLLRNAYMPIELPGGRIWLAGLDDAVNGHPDLELAIPRAIRNVPNEPVVLMCHAPDYADVLLDDAAGKSVCLMLSGHTHGGQVRLPMVGALYLPGWGRRYDEGWFRLRHLRLYVNRGIGTLGVPLRLNCPPEITIFNLQRG